ncbi:MAG TPA: hypothetical protein PK264_22785, partial [Hyphomicrobiaceae bacterium]|nr:hypothetical protein [Hyphomicrobiaceae bacterium]
GCRECAEGCRAELAKRRDDIVGGRRQCELEGRTLDALVAQRAGIAVLDAFARAAKCAAVKARAAGLVAGMLAGMVVPAPVPVAPPVPVTPAPIMPPAGPAVVPPGTAPGALVRSWEGHGG